MRCLCSVNRALRSWRITARTLVSCSYLEQIKLLLLDEPLGALDALTRLEMKRLIEQLWLEQGFTAVLVTHDIGESVTLADRVVVLGQGGITLDVPVDGRAVGTHGSMPNAIESCILDLVLGDPPEKKLCNREADRTSYM